MLASVFLPSVYFFNRQQKEIRKKILFRLAFSRVWVYVYVNFSNHTVDPTTKT
jgi:hypothetical protein